MSDSVQRLIDFTKYDLSNLKKNPLKNFAAINQNKTFLKSIQGMNEAQRDILNTRINNFTSSTGKEIAENNYSTYAAQIAGIYEMYEGRAKYGGEILGGILNTRVAFIAGEGLSVISRSPATQKFIDDFIKKNKLNGSRLITMVETGELEGRNLITLKAFKPADKRDKWHIKARSFSWKVNPYTIETVDNDTDEIKQITYKDKTDADKPKTISGKECVYTKLGGIEYSLDNTTNGLHRVLTNIENMSRAVYDLRKNTHLFGKTMPYWETESIQAASAINTAVNSGEWEIGRGYAGGAKFSLVEPSGGAAKAIIDDILINLKAVSTSTGIPIHFLAWPELMSNRATADNLMEMVKAATQKDRLIWEEAFTEIIEKAMQLAIDNGIATNEILNEFTVKLPIVSIALLKQIIEVWEPLHAKDLISTFSFLNMLPGINPADELKKVKEEIEERAKNSSMNNQVVNNSLNKIQQNKNQTIEDDSNDNDEY